MAVVGLVSTLSLTAPAFADGGKGGDAHSFEDLRTNTGGAGGGDGAAGQSAAGGPGSTNNGGGGGGGGGAGGGAGGSGASSPGGAIGGSAGIDGASDSTNLHGAGGGGGGNGGNNGYVGSNVGFGSPLAGGNGNSGGNGGSVSGVGITVAGGGGGGGAGGYGVVDTGGSVGNLFGISGGSGGAGGRGGDATGTDGGQHYGGSGGNGGDGSAGVTIIGSGLLSNYSTLRGGNGGDGGSGGIGTGSLASSGTGGNGGSGAAGLQVDASGGSLLNFATIQGGDGGAAGAGGVGVSGASNGAAGAVGAGGAGVVGADLSIDNTAGTISGGLSGDGVTRANAITFTGGNNTLTLAGNGGLTGNIGLATGSSVTFNQSTDVALANVITGGGNVNVGAVGTLTLSGANTYSGATTVSGTTLRAGAANAFSAVSAVAMWSGAVLDLNGYNQTIASLSGLSDDTATSVSLGSATLTTGGNNSSTIYAGTISGTGRLIKAGTGTFTLNGASTYTGGTTVSAGTLQIGNGGTSGSITGNITDNATLVFNRSDDVTYAGVISGSGALVKDGAGTLVLAGSNSYSGGTTINAGTLQLGDGVVLPPSLGNFVDGGTLMFNYGYVTVFSGTISDGATPGQVVIAAGRQVNFYGSNTYTGGTTILAGGVLQLGSYGQRGSIVGNVANAGTLFFARMDDMTFAGAISDGASAGRVNKTYASTITLTGNSTYTGGTNIWAGTLQLGNGGTTGAIVGNVANGGTLSFNRSNAYTFDGVISDYSSTHGQLLQAGTGKTTLTARSTYTGATTVEAGTLSVNGDISSSSGVTVNSGGTLGGNGFVSSTTIDGGTLAPGNSIGTLNVVGNLVMTSASSYMVEVSPSNADRVNVTGTATLGGATVNASFAAGSYVAKQYTIVNATGGVSGTFGSQVNTNLPASFTSSLSYDTSNAYLNLTLTYTPPAGPTAPVFNPLNANQRSVGNTLVNYFNRTGGIPLAFGALNAQGLSQVSGELGSSGQQTAFNAMNQFTGIMTDPDSAGRDNAGASAPGHSDAVLGYAARRPSTDAFAAMTHKAPPVMPAFEERWNVWAAGFGGSQATAGNALAGNNKSSSSIYGAAVGADYWLSPLTVAGFSMAGGGTSFSVDGGGSGYSDLFQAGGFVRHTVGTAYVTAAAAYGWQDVTTDRYVTAAGIDHLRANFNTNSYSGRIEIGDRFVTPWIDGIGLTPYGAVQVTAFDLPAYAERAVSGASTFALAYGGKTTTATRTELGLRSDKSFAVTDAILTLRGRAAWAHDYNTDRSASATFQSLPGASFAVNGAAPASNAALTTASAELKWTNGWSVAATFDGEFSDVTESYSGKGVVRYAW